MSKFSEQELFRRGYREFPVDYPEHAEQYYQRRVIDPANSRRALYFINVYRWTVNGSDAWEARAQFNFDDGPTLNLEAFNTDNLDQCENLIAKAFTTLGAKPYDSD